MQTVTLEYSTIKFKMCILANTKNMHRNEDIPLTKLEVYPFLPKTHNQLFPIFSNIFIIICGVHQYITYHLKIPGTY